MLARRFLWVIAGLTVLVIAGAIVYRLFEKELMRWAMVPSAPFRAGRCRPAPTIASRGMWIARPDIAGNPVAVGAAGLRARRATPRASVFFVHPTSFLESTAWNAPLDDPESQRSRRAVRAQPGERVQRRSAQIWAPKYRQATFGAFLTSKDECPPRARFRLSRRARRL